MIKPIAYNPAEFGEAILAFKRLCVAQENGATPFARKALAGLLSGGATVDSITLSVLEAFGKPKTPKEKPLTKLSSSGDHVPGFGAARKTCASIFAIFANTGLNPAIRETVSAFVLEAEGSAKSLAALDRQVKQLVAEHIAATMPNLEDEGESEGEGEASETPASETPAVDIADMANRLSLALENASEAELEAAGPAIAALVSRLGALFDIFEPQQVAEAA